jgi:hypothetical protein
MKFWLTYFTCAKFPIPLVFEIFFFKKKFIIFIFQSLNLKNKRSLFSDYILTIKKLILVLINSN